MSVLVCVREVCQKKNLSLSTESIYVHITQRHPSHRRNLQLLSLQGLHIHSTCLLTRAKQGFSLQTTHSLSFSFSLSLSLTHTLCTPYVYIYLSRMDFIILRVFSRMSMIRILAYEYGTNRTYGQNYGYQLANQLWSYSDWTKENALVSTYDEDETPQTPSSSLDGCEDNGIDFENHSSDT